MENRKILMYPLGMSVPFSFDAPGVDALVRSVRSVRIANYFRTSSERFSWGPRTISDFEFIYDVEGSSYYRQDGLSLRLKEGDLLLIPARTEHVFSTDPLPGTVISCIHFSVRAPGLGARVFKAGKDPVILSLFRRCVDEFGRRPVLYQTVLERLVGEIWVRILRIEEDSLKAVEPERMRAARKFIAGHFSEPIDREEVSSAVGITPQHLNHLFKKFARTTPRQMIEDLRIRKARRLLLEGDSTVSVVSRKSGFDDPLYFSKVFRKTTGLSPSEFKRQL